MLHCEQLCFKAGSHQGMFSETSGSILSCFSIHLPLQSLMLVQVSFLSYIAGKVKLCTHSLTHTHTIITCDPLQFNTTYVSCSLLSSGERCWHSSTHRKTFRMILMRDWHCRSVFIPVYIILIVPSESIQQISHLTSSMCPTIFSLIKWCAYALTFLSDRSFL